MAELRAGKGKLQVIPDDTRQPTVATLKIKTDYPPDNPEMRYAYARIIKLHSWRG